MDLAAAAAVRPVHDRLPDQRAAPIRPARTWLRPARDPTPPVHSTLGFWRAPQLRTLRWPRFSPCARASPDHVRQTPHRCLRIRIGLHSYTAATENERCQIGKLNAGTVPRVNEVQAVDDLGQLSSRDHTASPVLHVGHRLDRLQLLLLLLVGHHDQQTGRVPVDLLQEELECEPIRVANSAASISLVELPPVDGGVSNVEFVSFEEAEGRLEGSDAFVSRTRLP